MFTKYTSDAQRFSSDECFQMHSVLILIEAQGLEVERLLSLNCFEELFNNGITIGQDKELLKNFI